MKTDSDPAGPARMDSIERAHLKDPRDASHVIHRYEVDGELRDLLQRFWIPVWSVPPGTEAPQKVLQYPVSLIVVSADYARFYGVVSGLSTTTLSGDGWAVGLMCAPSAGHLLTGAPMAAYTDRSVDASEVLGDAGRVLTDEVRTAMSADPRSPAAHRAAMAAYDGVLRRYLPVDPEGHLVNRVVAFVESSSDVTRVAQVCAEFDLSERALQRLVHRRIGLTPKWLIQRRRLQEAAERLRTRSAPLGDVAAVLGYADQPHVNRDFSKVTGMTPGGFAALHTDTG
ncbi:MAG: Transcriptional regulator, AraC family [Modestobacter sp.]|jgi:AraC-like DNA-binding protein|nr:Transcriptional regulator, AraC family [Modestobacter sp.]